MSMTPELIDAVERLLGATQGDAALAQAALRKVLPGLVVMRCDAEDVLEEPYRSLPAFDLHLVDTRNHCTAMTDDPAVASGVLIAVKAVA